MGFKALYQVPTGKQTQGSENIRQNFKLERMILNVADVRTYGVYELLSRATHA
jgi:hypothetical protein